MVMPTKARIYIALVGLAAAPLLYWYGRELSPSHWPLLLGMIAVTVTFTLWRVESPTGQSFTFNSAVDLLAIILGGPALVVWVTGVGQLLSAMILGWDLRRTIFNVGQTVLTVSAAGTVFTLLGRPRQLDGFSLLAAAAAATVYFLANSLLVANLFTMLQRKAFLTVWLGMVKQGVEAYLLVEVLGLVTAFFLLQGGLTWVLILALLLLALQRVLSAYYRTLRANNEATRHRAVQDSLLQAMVTALDARDMYTSGHSNRVAAYTDLLAAEMGLDDRARDELRYASLLHDVGKLGIPDAVLRKEGPLTPTERSLMMEHPVRGINILGQMPNIPEAVLAAVKHHHEWVNGGGYPDGLKGDQIPLGARIIGVADALDAMTSARPYRPGMPWQEALNRIKQGQATQFDPDVVAALLRINQKRPDLMHLAGGHTPAYPSELERRLDEERAQGNKPSTTGRILPIHSREIKILYQLALERRSLLDLAQTLHRTLEVLYDTVGSHTYCISLIDQQTQQLAVRSVAGSSKDLSGIAWPAESPAWRALKAQKQPALIADEEQIRIRSIGAETRSLLVVPLVSGDQLIGALQVESIRPGAFGEDELYLLTAVARQVADAIEVGRIHERMTYAATHDGLTGTLNRTTFYHQLHKELEQARALGQPVAVAVLDINNFKEINDTHGHLAGDHVIQCFGQFLAGRLRRTDLVARYGGDEFAVIMPNATREEAARRIELIASGGEEPIVVGDRQLRPASAAWGVASFPEDGSAAEELVAAADHDMYRRKRAPQPISRAG
jgi:diguanylate cyclase (GGDEF)-like protein